MRLFGLIGYPLTHSFSQQYFMQKFEREHIDCCSYINLPLSTIEKFTIIQQQYPNLVGCNVTIPYKQSILPYVDEQLSIVQQIGACNCIYFKNGKSIAYNTDIIGFKKSFIEKKETHHTKALILGTGGASKAVQYVCHELGVSYTFVSRYKKENTITYKDVTPSLLQDYTIIIQTTPLGTYPNIYNAPDIPYHALTSKHYCFDLVYNPSETLFLQKAKTQGAIVQNGYNMLCIQAEESWEIWNKSLS